MTASNLPIVYLIIVKIMSVLSYQVQQVVNVWENVQMVSPAITAFAKPDRVMVLRVFPMSYANRVFAQLRKER